MNDFKLQKPRGTRDFLEEDVNLYNALTDRFFEVAKQFDFERIETPLFEDTRLYLKGIGTDTDVGGKEMYNLTRGEEELNLSLRPEFTAGVIRAYVENGFASRPQPVRLASSGPVFRHERPQKGRYRDPRQLNLEIIGSQNPYYDASILLMTKEFIERIGIENVKFKVSSTGDKSCRPNYIKKLTASLREFSGELCEDCQRRIDTNSLRVLDCKNPNCREIVSRVPSILDSLCKGCESHLKEFLENLDSLGVTYAIDPYLVRGLDYYTKSVFEVFAGDDQLAIGGGGRYDGLVELYGAPATPAVGIGLGLDRISEVADKKTLEKKTSTPDVFLVVLGPFAKKKAYKIVPLLIKGDLSLTLAPDKESLAAQLKAADRSNAKIAVIIGQKEAQADQAILRDMSMGQQENVAIDHLVPVLKSKLGK